MSNDKFFYENFDVQHIEDVPDDQNTVAKRIEGEFTDLVAYLKNPEHINCPPINKLIGLFEKLVGNYITPVALTPSVQSLLFYCEQRKNKTVCFIMCPSNWHEMLLKDPFMQMGGLVFIASQAKDYWNLRLSSQYENRKEEIKNRARSYEAELLNYFAKYKSEKFSANDWQKETIKLYPGGIMSEPSHYEGRDYDAKFPPFPFTS
jgi:hypothetical protein